MDKTEISQEDYTAFQRFLENISGIKLAAGKEYLVASRLKGLMQHHNISTLGELHKRLRSGDFLSLQQAVVDAMTTNETFWFRDISHYSLLTHQLFPEYASSNRNRLSIWSAACSTGQEPYNISMMVEEYQSRHPQAQLPDTQITATDISGISLADARDGIYCGMSASRGLSADQQRRYFVPHGECLAVRDEIKARVRFRELNLIEDFKMSGMFDIIFCRNVLIYFSSERKHEILTRLASALKPGGYLFIGSTESLSSCADLFDVIPGYGGFVYRLREQ